MNIAQSLIAVDSVVWTPVVVPSASLSGRPFNVKRIIVSNNEAGALDIYRRIVSSSATTQLTIPAGTQEEWIMSDDPRGITGYAAAQNGDAVSYLKSSSGSFNVSVLFIG
ncbi:MAG: hypothetical protein EBR82_07180 [Caulobacteraceae bacterium]|nr:hypothetical protein [Caulobacteraceae bacterium]